jgi:hypothetical protein
MRRPWPTGGYRAINRHPPSSEFGGETRNFFVTECNSGNLVCIRKTGNLIGLKYLRTPISVFNFLVLVAGNVNGTVAGAPS